MLTIGRKLIAVAPRAGMSALERILLLLPVGLVILIVTAFKTEEPKAWSAFLATNALELLVLGLCSGAAWYWRVGAGALTSVAMTAAYNWSVGDAFELGDFVGDGVAMVALAAVLPWLDAGPGVRLWAGVGSKGQRAAQWALFYAAYGVRVGLAEVGCVALGVALADWLNFEARILEGVVAAAGLALLLLWRQWPPPAGVSMYGWVVPHAVVVAAWVLLGGLLGWQDAAGLFMLAGLAAAHIGWRDARGRRLGDAVGVVGLVLLVGAAALRISRPAGDTGALLGMLDWSFAIFMGLWLGGAALLVGFGVWWRPFGAAGRVHAALFATMVFVTAFGLYGVVQDQWLEWMGYVVPEWMQSVQERAESKQETALWRTQFWLQVGKYLPSVAVLVVLVLPASYVLMSLGEAARAKGRRSWVVGGLWRVLGVWVSLVVMILVFGSLGKLTGIGPPVSIAGLALYVIGLVVLLARWALRVVTWRPGAAPALARPAIGSAALPIDVAAAVREVREGKS